MPNPRQRKSGGGGAAFKKNKKNRKKGDKQASGSNPATTVAIGVFLGAVGLAVVLSVDFSPVAEYVPPIISATGRRSLGAEVVEGWNATEPMSFTELYSDLYPCDGGYLCAKQNPRNHMALRNGETHYCDFDVLEPNDLTFERFEREYRNKKPFVLNTKASDWTMPSQFTRDFFTDHFTSMPTDVGGSLDIVRYSGKGYMEMSTGEFMDTFMAPAPARHWASEPLYTFSRITGASPEDSKTTGMHWMKEYKGLFTLGGAKDFPHKTYCLFMMGPAGSGTSFHFHQEAWTGLIYGRKRWFFYDPDHRTPPGGFYPSVAATQWLEEDYRDLAPEDKPQECLQQPGQLFYVPEHWFHAVVNVDDVVAISMQNVTKHTDDLRQVQAKDLPTLKAATERYPNRSDVFFTYARQMLKDSKDLCNEAVPYFDQALKLDPRFVLAHVERAKCVEVTVGPEAAAHDLKAALDLNPYSFSTRREIRQLMDRHPNHDFSTVAGREDWTKNAWVVGPFEDVRKLISANLDLDVLTSRKI
eukprot:INCI16741.1.p1 GENE.INCI16741.1~~INCI16741.1.p1  ORF type:complete len:527 (-),score=69.81 INCI16741.1:205-1785(-)